MADPILEDQRSLQIRQLAMDHLGIRIPYAKLAIQSKREVDAKVDSINFQLIMMDLARESGKDLNSLSRIEFRQLQDLAQQRGLITFDGKPSKAPAAIASLRSEGKVGPMPVLRSEKR